MCSTLSFIPALLCFYWKDFCFVYLCIGGLVVAHNGANFYAYAYGKRKFEKMQSTELSKMIKEKSMEQKKKSFT